MNAASKCRFCGRPTGGPWEFCDADCETDFDTFKAADLDGLDAAPDAPVADGGTLFTQDD